MIKDLSKILIKDNFQLSVTENLYIYLYLSDITYKDTINNI